MMAAYKLQAYQIIGGPPWLDSDRYDIVAKAENDPNEDQVVEMIKSLLTERFKLSFHQETKELPVYALVTAKNGARLKANTDGGKNDNAGAQRGKITGRSIPLERSADVRLTVGLTHKACLLCSIRPQPMDSEGRRWRGNSSRRT
jgi:uncharacterized protein (TIGR03435 family)